MIPQPMFLGLLWIRSGALVLTPYLNYFYNQSTIVYTKFITKTVQVSSALEQATKCVKVNVHFLKKKCIHFYHTKEWEGVYSVLTRPAGGSVS